MCSKYTYDVRYATHPSQCAADKCDKLRESYSYKHYSYITTSGSSVRNPIERKRKEGGGGAGGRGGGGGSGKGEGEGDGLCVWFVCLFVFGGFCLFVIHIFFGGEG